MIDADTLSDRRRDALARFLAENAELFAGHPEDGIGCIDGASPAGIVLVAWWDAPADESVAIGAWADHEEFDDWELKIAREALGYAAQHLMCWRT